MRVLRWLPSLVLLVPWLIGPIAPPNEVRIRDLAAPSAFRLLDWETVHLADHAPRLWTGLFGGGLNPFKVTAILDAAPRRNGRIAAAASDTSSIAASR